MLIAVDGLESCCIHVSGSKTWECVVFLLCLLSITCLCYCSQMRLCADVLPVFLSLFRYRHPDV
jgi:hypothetical protein